MIYTIADLHLSFGEDKSMEVFRGWENYTERIKQNWQRIVEPDDTVVIAGDISWAMKLSEINEDFQFIQKLNGKKIILKGNHDYWWTTKLKMDRYLIENGFDSVRILHNNYFMVEDTAICGTRGWFYDAEKDEDMLILKREVGRLKMSIEPAIKDGYEPVVFLHYPPIYNNIECEEIMNVLREYNIKKCFYGHVHEGNAAKKAFNGEKDGISFRLIACDYIKFTPVSIK
ncbi:MAG: metallophosphoesterase [Clostridia bacterium]|nr:metallophosphoesterase [Clostridia bacterium]